jgi:hypothetical protein
MSWFVPHIFPRRRDDFLANPPAEPQPAPVDFDELLANLREVHVAVPCGGCGGAHEMTCAEIVARQLLRGSGWSSEECDDGVQLAAIITPEEVAACGGDPDTVRALLNRRGALRPLDEALTEGAAVHASRREPHHILPTY